jgi:hypothetical protein
MLIRNLFVSNVTRDIPPVVYFHEQSPEKLAAEVSEYIVTGGWPENHPHHRRVPDGIHEQYVWLLTNIAAELDKAGGPDLPNAWISGFYGSGKSIFAKLLGFALDGVAMPDGSSLADADARKNDESAGRRLTLVGALGATHARPMIRGDNRARFPSYDIAPDGRFLIIRGQAEPAPARRRARSGRCIGSRSCSGLWLTK